MGAKDRLISQVTPRGALPSYPKKNIILYLAFYSWISLAEEIFSVINKPRIYF